MSSKTLSNKESGIEIRGNTFEEQWETLLKKAGIQVGGTRPWDMQVHNPGVYDRIMVGRSLGLGDSYMDGWWDSAALDEFFYRLLQIQIQEISITKFTAIVQWFGAYLRNRQTLSRARQVAERHYDLDNELFAAMLDPTLAYSCGYWLDAHTLHEAQLAKLDLICRKLELEPGMRMLDIGCGWGSLAWHAARHYGAIVDGVTVSVEQQKYAQQRCADLPVSISLRDYREIEGQYDRVVSVGMFEHVGKKNYRTYMHITERLLRPNGLALLHTIGENAASTTFDPWINKYIFPNGELPALQQISAAAENIFVIEDVQNFGPDYDKTLMAWDENFVRAWPRLEHHYDERFYRMWRYYLNVCAGAFRARNLQLWQCVLSKPGQRRATYISPR
jgi:cyclopropane-fatty-acyl-phospholipid synthase